MDEVDFNIMAHKTMFDTLKEFRTAVRINSAAGKIEERLIVNIAQ